MNFGPYGPGYADATCVTHAYPESLFGAGEVMLNHASTGSAGQPALLLVPPQTLQRMRPGVGSCLLDPNRPAPPVIMPGCSRR